jgi:hypothetical protein
MLDRVANRDTDAHTRGAQFVNLRKDCSPPVTFEIAPGCEDGFSFEKERLDAFDGVVDFDACAGGARRIWWHRYGARAH